jgi:hypothetical protein
MAINAVQKITDPELYGFWKIDKIAYEKGQMPEWLNTIIDPDSFFTNPSGVVRVSLGDSMKSPAPFEGDYITVRLDEDGEIPKKKPKITAVTAEDFEEQFAQPVTRGKK